MSGYVGRPPGTTTFRLDGLGSPWAPGYPDPSQRYMPKGAEVIGPMAVPHDFELARYWNYTPIMQSWTMGRKTNQPPGVSVSPYEGLGLGAESAEEAQIRNDLEHQMMMQRMAEEMKTLRWNRIWSGVSALAAVGAVAISIAAFRRRR